jgi:hypothetical protein
MQQGLEKALARAGQADDRELAGRVREDGQRLVVLLNGLIRTSRLYGPDNAAFEGPSTEVARVLQGLIDLLGVVHVICVEDQIYVNEVRLRVRAAEQEVAALLIEELSRHDVGGVSFHSALGAQQVRALTRALSAPAEGTGASTRAALAARIHDLRGDVELTGRYRFRVKGDRPKAARDHGEVLRQGALVASEALANLAAGRLPNPLPVRRAVVDLVDSLRDDPDRAAAAPLRRRTAGAGEHHLLAVSSLAIQLGLALGLDDAPISDLGVSAMLHDVGYARAGGREAHCGAGVRILLRQRGFHEGKIRRLSAVHDHHADAGAGAHLFARILRIVDDYDVLTAPRPGQPHVPPPTAQASMWAARGSAYDADLLALFVQTMGLYPPGSVLELSDGRRVLSVSGGRDPERFAWPIVRVLQEADGTRRDGAEAVDLFGLRTTLRVKKILNPSTAGVDVADAVERVFGAVP